MLKLTPIATISKTLPFNNGEYASIFEIDFFSLKIFRLFNLNVLHFSEYSVYFIKDNLLQAKFLIIYQISQFFQ